MSIDIRHDLIHPDLRQLLLVILACLLVLAVPILLVVLPHGFRVGRLHVHWQNLLSQLVFEHAVVEVLHPLVPRLQIVRFQVQCAAAGHHRHAYVVQFFGQTMPAEDICGTDADFDVNDVLQWYPSHLVFLPGVVDPTDPCFLVVMETGWF